MCHSIAFDGMHLDVDFLSGPEFGQDYVGIRRRRGLGPKDGRLFTLWHPHDIGRED